MSKRKFDYLPFYMSDGNTCVAFNAQKYGCNEAKEIAKDELGANEVICKTMYVYYGYGVDDDGDRRLCYWISEEKYGNSFIVWAFFEGSDYK